MFLQVKSCLIEGMGDTIGISDKGTGCWGSAGSGFVIKWLTTCWRLRPLWLIFDVECCLIQGNVGLVGRDDGCLSSMASYLLVGYCTVSDMQVLPLRQCNIVYTTVYVGIFRLLWLGSSILTMVGDDWVFNMTVTILLVMALGVITTNGDIKNNTAYWDWGCNLVTCWVLFYKTVTDMIGGYCIQTGMWWYLAKDHVQSDMILQLSKVTSYAWCDLRVNVWIMFTWIWTLHLGYIGSRGRWFMEWWMIHWVWPFVPEGDKCHSGSARGCYHWTYIAWFRTLEYDYLFQRKKLLKFNGFCWILADSRGSRVHVVTASLERECETT
jgi:hypothetical protein